MGSRGLAGGDWLGVGVVGGLGGEGRENRTGNWAPRPCFLRVPLLWLRGKKGQNVLPHLERHGMLPGPPCVFRFESLSGLPL